MDMARKSKFTDEKIVRAVREIESGAVSQSEMARRLGVNVQTIYRWKERFSGLQVNEAKRLRSLEEENARLKKLLAETLLDKEMLQTALAKKW
jgi:putative transposase